jgi:myo-inositol catabolism protein IolS
MERSSGIAQMPLRRLGSRGPTISVVGHGAWEAGSTEWGAAPPDDQVVQAMITAFEAGVTWIDTDEIYGSGHSEELVAMATKAWPDVKVFT